MATELQVFVLVRVTVRSTRTLHSYDQFVLGCIHIDTSTSTRLRLRRVLVLVSM